MMQRKNGKKLSAGCSARSKGYTLIEMAVAIMIMGLLIAPAADVYSNYLKQQHRQTTLVNVQYALSAMNTYRTANGYFPCPSGLNVPRTAPSYGTPVDCSSGGAFAVNPVPGTCDAAPGGTGICIEQSQRVAVPPFDAFHQRVIVGAVPFRLLQMTEDQAYDGYGSRLVYVLTQSMGDPATQNTLNGGISIQDAAGNSRVNPPDSAVFAILSPGLDRVGGWTRDGGVFGLCTGALGADVGNCNPKFEGGAAKLLAIYTDSYASTAIGATHYDDYLTYFQSQPDPLWSFVPGTSNIKDLTSKSVGVGAATPAADGVQLEISAATVAPPLSDASANTDSLLVYGTGGAGYNGNAGKILAGDPAHTDNICDAAGANCFNPKQIGGNNAIAGQGMKCAAGYMAGIDTPGNPGTGGADCYAIPMTCPPNTVVKDITNGVLTCAAIPSNCLVADQPICSGPDATTVHLNPSGPGVVQPAVPATVNAANGGCRQVQWTCNGGTGAWIQTTDINPGLCSFAPVVTPCDCSQQGPNFVAGACPGQLSSVCGGGAPTDTRDFSACTCIAPVTTSQACPAPFTGGTEQRITTYTLPTCAGVTVPPAPAWDTAGCQCALPATTTANVACPAGYNNGNAAVQTGTLDPATCTYSYSTDNTACACIPPNPTTQTITVSCPAGGSGTQDQTFNSTPGICAWQDTGGINGCVCPADYTDTQACPAPGTGSQTRPATYGAPPACTLSFGAWDTSSCACPADYTDTAACPAPALGNETRPATYGAAPGCALSFGAWSLAACTCPADTTNTQPCPGPFTGGNETQSVTYGSAPTCAQTLGSWSTAACQCAKPATKHTITGCGTGYNAGNIDQLKTLDPLTCTYSDTGPPVNTCACTMQAPFTAACGACAAPFTGTAQCDYTFSNTAGPPSPPNCAYSSGAPYGCTCDTTPQPISQPHDCTLAPYSGTDCYTPNLADPDTGTQANSNVPPGTCTAGAQNWTHQGSCTLIPFRWGNAVAIGNDPSRGGANPNILGQGCGCPEHRNTLSGSHDICYDSVVTSFTQYQCDCQ